MDGKFKWEKHSEGRGNKKIERNKGVNIIGKALMVKFLEEYRI